MKKEPLGQAARDDDSSDSSPYSATTPFIETALDVEALALSHPAEYQRLLDGFFLLLGQRRLWWARCSEADDPTWRTCVRDAIVEIAQPSGWSPARLADLLDLEGEFPKTKQRILRLARERFYRKAVTL